MPAKFHMRISDVFFFADGRTVFAGNIEEEERGAKLIMDPGPATILVDGNTFAMVNLEREVIPSRSVIRKPEVRAFSTRDVTGLTREVTETKICTLEGTMRYAGHRHLLGIDSPPRDYIPDDMTLGPVIPEGWDGDAWMKPGGGGYFLRAWNKNAARYATAHGDKYEQAREKLLAEIAGGGKTVEIRATETKGSPT